MARNNKEKLIKSVLPVTESTWLVQPITVTVSKFDYDTTQTKFLVAIVEGLQESIKQSITKEVKQLPLFSDGVHENELKMEIPLKSLGVDPRRYPEIKQSLIKLATTPFEMPVKDKEGKKYMRYAGLCEVYIPEEKYVRSVIVKIKHDVALSLIDAKVNGYQKYLKQVVTRTKNKYTQRIYLYITAWKSKGETIIKVDTLRSILQLEDKYPRWNSFYTQVIKSAEKELRENFEAGLSECCFTAEPVYKPGQRRIGTPEALHFKIEISKQEQDNITNSSYASLKIQSDDKLRVALKIRTKRKREQILRLVDQNNIHTFFDYLINLERVVDQQKAIITDQESYIYASCMRFLKKGIPDAEVLSTKSYHEIDDTEQSFKKEIAAFRKTIKKSLGEDIYNVWIDPLSFFKIEQMKEGYSFVLQVPTKFVYEMIETKYITQLKESLKVGFKQEVVAITYRVRT